MNLKRLLTDRFYLASISFHILLCVGLLWGIKLQKIQKIPKLKVSLYLEPIQVKVKPLPKEIKAAPIKPLKKLVPPKKKSLTSRFNSSEPVLPFKKRRLISPKTLPSHGFLKGNEFTRLREKSEKPTSVTPDSNREKKILLKPIELKSLLKDKNSRKVENPTRTEESQNLKETGVSGKNIDVRDSGKGFRWIKKSEKRTYQKLLHNKIAKNWILPPISQKFHQIKLKIVLALTGEIKSVTLIEKSDYAVLNISAYRAVQKAAPFPTLPGSFQMDEKDVEFTIYFLPTGE